MTDREKILKLTMQKNQLISSMEVCVEGYRDTQWGWDGDCGSDQWIDMLEDTISEVSKQDEAN